MQRGTGDCRIPRSWPRPASPGCGPAAAAEVLVICLGKGRVRGAAAAVVASASVNTGQQLGGSIGTLCSTRWPPPARPRHLTAHLSARTLAGGKPGVSLVRVAQVHGYTTAFWWACAIFCFGAVVAAVLFRWGPLATQGQRAAAKSAGTGAQGSPRRAQSRVEFPGTTPGRVKLGRDVLRRDVLSRGCRSGGCCAGGRCAGGRGRQRPFRGPG